MRMRMRIAALSVKMTHGDGRIVYLEGKEEFSRILVENERKDTYRYM
jgi:hypothetical protein